jgi:hypothetical protein
MKEKINFIQCLNNGILDMFFSLIEFYIAYKL